MGLTTSKETPTNNNDFVESPCQPHRKLSFDPRSPSVGINRTPILVPATPTEAVRDGPSEVFDPRSPAETFVRSPVRFNFSELEQALTDNKDEPSLNDVNTKQESKQLSETKAVTPPTTPRINKQTLSSTPLAVRSANVHSQSTAATDGKSQQSMMECTAEHSPMKMANGRTNLRQMAHHQNHVRRKSRGQRRIVTVQDENSPRTIRL